MRAGPSGGDTTRGVIAWPIPAWRAWGTIPAPLRTSTGGISNEWRRSWRGAWAIPHGGGHDGRGVPGGGRLRAHVPAVGRVGDRMAVRVARNVLAAERRRSAREHQATGR